MAAVKKPVYASSEDAEQEAVVEYCDLLAWCVSLNDEKEKDALGAFNDDMTIVSYIGDYKTEKSIVSQMRRRFYKTNENGVCEH